MLIHNADITGSLTINGIPYNTGSFTGSFFGDGSQLSGVTSYTNADTLAFINSIEVVSGSIETRSTVSDTFTSVTSYTVTHNFDTKEVIVSVYENDTLIFPSSINTPTTNTVTITFPEPVTGRVVVVKAGHIVSGSINYDSVLNKPTLVSGSSQITYSDVTGIPSGIVSGSAQIAAFGYATTGSNQFNGSQVITGSLTVTGEVVAQTLNVQEVTSSIVFSSGSNIFGNDLGNTQQLTGSVSITGSLTVNGSGLVPYTGATADVNLEGSSITSAMVYISGLNTGGEGGVLNLKKGSTRVIGGSDAANTISVWADGTTLGFNDVAAGGVRSAKFSVASITNNATRTYTLPNADGTLALTSNLSDYLPLIGGTLTGPLGGTSATFSANISIGTPSAAPAQGLLVQGDFIFNGLGQELNTTNKSTASLILGGNSLLGRVSFKNVPGTGFITNVYEPLIYSLHSGTVAGSGSSSLVIQAGSTLSDRHLYFRTADTTRLFIENNGNVGIGTASPSGAAGLALALNSGANQCRIALKTSGTGDAAGDGFQIGVAGTSAFIEQRENDDLTLATNASERMRITAGGFSKHSNNGVYGNAQTNSTFHEFHRNDNGVGLNVFCETSSYTSSVLVLNCTRVTSNGTYSFIEAAHQNVAVVFRVADSGNVQNTNGSYGTIASDRRLKENIVSATPKLDDLLKLNIVNFNLIGNEEKHIGFIAQEMQEVFPSFVHKTDTRKYDEDGNLISGLEDALGIKVGMEFAILVKAIQEQQSQIEILKVENDNLKSRLEVLEQA